MPGSFGGSALARARAFYNAGGSAPLHAPPAFLGIVPSAIDDEFDSPAIASAWTYFGYYSQANLAIGASPDRFQNNVVTPRATTTRRRSWLQIQQGTTNTEGWLTRPWPVPAGTDFFLWCRAYADNGVSPARTQLGFSSDHGSVANAPKIGAGISTYLSIGVGSDGIAQADALNGTGNTQTLGTGGMSLALQRPEYYGFYRKGASVVGGVWYDNGETILFGAGSFAFTPTRVGFRFVDGGGGVMHGIDFIRLETGPGVLPRWAY